MKKIIFISGLWSLVSGLCIAEDIVYDDTDWIQQEAFAEDDGGADLTAVQIELNDGAVPKVVSDFDIMGIMLGMPFEDVQTMFFKDKNLYGPREKNSIIYTLHNEWKYNLDYECRAQKIIAPTQLDNCIKTLARSRGLLYASEMHLERESTGEKITVYFTSNATDNVVWRVVYENDVNTLEGANEKFDNQREKKILAFWQGILDKYGAPNSGDDKWASGDNAYEPYMQAFYGMLDLRDMGRNANDDAKNYNAARDAFPAKPYAF